MELFTSYAIKSFDVSFIFIIWRERVFVLLYGMKHFLVIKFPWNQQIKANKKCQIHFIYAGNGEKEK